MRQGVTLDRVVKGESTLFGQSVRTVVFLPAVGFAHL